MRVQSQHLRRSSAQNASTIMYWALVKTVPWGLGEARPFFSSFVKWHYDSWHSSQWRAEAWAVLDYRLERKSHTLSQGAAGGGAHVKPQWRHSPLLHGRWLPWGSSGLCRPASATAPRPSVFAGREDWSPGRFVHAAPEPTVSDLAFGKHCRIC